MNRARLLFAVILAFGAVGSACGGSPDSTSGVAGEQVGVGEDGEGEGDEGSPLMRPGENCLRCHNGSTEAPRFTVAGTLFDSTTAASSQGVAGATITVTDSSGKTVQMTSNAAGNFYTSQPLSFPAHVEVARHGSSISMPLGATSGACNLCHNDPPTGNAPGRVFAP